MALSAPVRASRRRQARAGEHADRDAGRARARLHDGRVRREARRRQCCVPAARRHARADDERPRSRRRVVVARAVAARRGRLAFGEVRRRDAADFCGNCALGARARRCVQCRDQANARPRTRNGRGGRARRRVTVARRGGSAAAVVVRRGFARGGARCRAGAAAGAAPRRAAAGLARTAGPARMRCARRRSPRADARHRRHRAPPRLSRLHASRRTIRSAIAELGAAASTPSSPTPSIKSPTCNEGQTEFRMQLAKFESDAHFSGAAYAS